MNAADHVGIGVTTVREILQTGIKQELVLMTKKGDATEGRVSIACEFFKLVADGNNFSASDHKGDGTSI